MESISDEPSPLIKKKKRNDSAASTVTSAEPSPMVDMMRESTRMKDVTTISPIKQQTEHTPLINKEHTNGSQEVEVYPLPWFRSPEWTRQHSSPPLSRTQRKRRRRRKNENSFSWMTYCCGFIPKEDQDVDTMEIGNTRMGENAAMSELDSQGFNYGAKCLVALILVVVAVLILIIFLHPVQEIRSS